MPSKKSIASRFIVGARLARPLVSIRSLLRSEVTILAYHRVLDGWDEQNYQFDVELISATTKDFAWQMNYVRDFFSPITFRDLIAFVDGEAVLPPRPILVTFDDGFDDNYHHAFPVLRRIGVPATIFLSTGYIGGARTFWYDWLCYLCNRAAEEDKTITIAGRDFCLNGGLQHRRNGIEMLFAHVKRIPDDLLRSEIYKVEAKLGLPFPTDGFSVSRPLTWSQVREMSDAGIEFGSHAVTHPILTNLSPEKLRDELTLSKRKIENEIARSVEVIAYPVGEEFAFNDSVIEASKAAGYRMGASYVSGVNHRDALDLFKLKRLHVERYTSRTDFQGMLAMPGLLA